MARRGLLMLMEISELQALAETYLGKISKEAKDQISSLFDKCNDFNVNSQKWSTPPTAVTADDSQDRLKQAIDMTMERVETWVPENWNELRNEINIAYDKFSNLRKKFYKFIEANNRNRGSELIKAYIARDIQDYVKYGINIILFCIEKNYIPKIWIGRIAIHFEMLARELEGLNVRNEDDLRRLAEDVSLYKQCMFELGNNFANNTRVINSKTYLKLFQKGGTPFSDRIKRKMNELKFEGEFQMLEDSEQLEVDRFTKASSTKSVEKMYQKLILLSLYLGLKLGMLLLKLS